MLLEGLNSVISAAVAVKANIKAMTKNTRNTINRTLESINASPEIPVNPKAPAIRAITSKMIAHDNIKAPLINY